MAMNSLIVNEDHKGNHPLYFPTDEEIQKYGLERGEEWCDWYRFRRSLK